MTKVQTFLNNIDEEKVTNLLNEVQTNSDYFTNITNQVVSAYSNDLDTLMGEIHIDINSENTIATETIEDHLLQLSSLLYYVGSRVEMVGIKADVSKAARQEVYNSAYLNNQSMDPDKKSKTTVAENVAVAEEESKYQTVIQSIYERVYKIIKFKIDAGYELLSSLKKVLSRRMQEIDTERMSRGL